jgi:hypothetical protein
VKEEDSYLKGRRLQFLTRAGQPGHLFPPKRPGGLEITIETGDAAGTVKERPIASRPPASKLKTPASAPCAVD